MKKIFLNIFTLIIAVNTINAQSFKTESSDLFEENIGIPVFVTSQGYTIFQYDDPKLKKMTITVFDKNHKLIIKKKEISFKKITYETHFTAQKSSNVQCWKEIDGKIKMYMESAGNSQYKAILNPETWALENEIELKGGFKKWGMDKEDHSVFDINTIDNKTDNRVEIETIITKLNKEQVLAKTDFNDVSKTTIKIHGPSDEIIQEVNYDYMNHKYQSGQAISVYFDDNVVYAVLKMFKINDRKSYDGASGFAMFGETAGQVGVVCLMKYDLKTKTIVNKELYDLKPEISFDRCKFHLDKDKISMTLQFIVKTGEKGAVLLTEGQVFYSFVFQSVDPQTLNITDPFYLPSEKLDQYVNAKCNGKNGYGGGFFNKCMVDDKGNFIATKVKNVNTASKIEEGYIYTSNPELIGVSYFDNKGKEVYGAAFPYNANVPPPPPHMPFYQSADIINRNNFDFTVCAGSKNNYIFLNNLPQNFNLPSDKKIETAKKQEDCNAVALEISPSGEIKQYYVFSEPIDKNSNKYIDFSSALYDQKNKTLIVKTYDGAGYKNTRATWIKFD